MVAAVALLLGGAAQGAGKAAPVNTSPPTISGTEREGETLTATSGTWSNSPTSFAYRWQKCDKNGNSCDNVSGGTNSTYKLKNGDAGHRFRVSVTASNSDGSANATSGATGVIAQGQEPKATAPPVISGTAKAGQTLTTTNGTWSNSPTSFAYQWRRCDTAGNNCHDVGQNRNTYKLESDDVGATIRVEVRGRNDFGSSGAKSAQTAVVQAAGPLPAMTAPPVISGLARSGQLLSASTGTWNGSPTKFKYQWARCDGAGNNCQNFGNDNQSQRLGPSEVGRTIRVTVSATNQFGTSNSTSVPTAVVTGAAAPAGAIPVTSVSLPNRLVISGVKFIPRRLSTRSAFVARFRVSDSNGRIVSGALVYALGIPYGWVRRAPEASTGADGWATIQFFPTRLMPIHRRAALVMFVRARKGGEPILGGVSARRLVQVGIG